MCGFIKILDKVCQVLYIYNQEVKTMTIDKKKSFEKGKGVTLSAGVFSRISGSRKVDVADIFKEQYDIEI